MYSLFNLWHFLWSHCYSKVVKNIFLENREKWIEVLSTRIFALYHRYWDRIQEGISVIIAKCFFPVQNYFSIKSWEKLSFIFLKSKFEWNLNDLPKDFSIKLSGIHFHSWKELSVVKLSYSGALKSYKFVWNIEYQSLFLNKVAGFHPATLFKRDSGAVDFLWILRNS